MCANGFGLAGFRPCWIGDSKNQGSANEKAASENQIHNHMGKERVGNGAPKTAVTMGQIEIVRALIESVPDEVEAEDTSRNSE